MYVWLSVKMALFRDSRNCVSDAGTQIPHRTARSLMEHKLVRTSFFSCRIHHSLHSAFHTPVNRARSKQHMLHLTML